jgi:hypothetical protein
MIAAGIAVEETAGLGALIAEIESPGTGCCLRRLPQKRAGRPGTGPAWQRPS